MPKGWKIIVISLLALTALAKFFSLLHPSKLLYQNDPIFNIPIRSVMAMGALLEAGICVFLCLVRDKRKAALAIFAFAALVLSYRAALFVNDVHYCPCLGNAVVWWPWLGEHEASVMVTIAVWLLVTASIQLFFRTGNTAKVSPSDSLPRRLIILVSLGVACFLFIWLAPWSPFSSNGNEATEFERMLLLLQRPETVHFASNNPAWFYSRIFASLFSITGFQFWLPRACTLATITVAWILLPRLLPSFRPAHLLLALLFFCSWPAMFFSMISATPQLPALALVIISIAAVQNIGKGKALCKFLLAAALSAIVIWLNITNVPIIIVSTTMVLLTAWIQLKAPAVNDGSGARAEKYQDLATCGESVAFAILCCLIIFRISDDVPSHQTQAIQLTASEAKAGFALSGLLLWIIAPGTILGALWGTIMLWRNRKLCEASFVLALLASVLVASFVRSEWSEGWIYLGAPVAILAGYGTGELWHGRVAKGTNAPRHFGAFFSAPTSGMLGAIIISLWLGFDLSNTLTNVQYVQQAKLRMVAAADVIMNYHDRVRWIYTRDKSLAAHGGYLVPPELIDIPGGPLRLGKRDWDYILEEVKKYNCDVLILQSAAELRQTEWLQFLKDGYEEAWSDGEGEAMFVAKGLSDNQNVLRTDQARHAF